MIAKNELHEGLVAGLGTGGEGIIKIEGATVFVPFCLVGERVRFKILKVGKGVAYGKLTSILQPAAERVTPPCPVFGKCGGCDLQHMSYSAQLEFKRAQIAAALLKIGGIDYPVSPTRPCEKQYGYRNKLALPVGFERGETVIGFYAPCSHRIVPIDDCNIQSVRVRDVIASIQKFIVAGVRGYDAERGTGELRHVVVRAIGDNLIFALVCARRIDATPLVEILKEKFASFTLLLNVNAKPSNAIFGEEWHTVYGDGFFGENECDITYRAGANTFLQVNDGIRAQLYSAVLAEAESGTTAIDLYSGGGLLTAMLAKKCGCAYGIEVVEEASRCADALKEENSLSGKMFNICGEAEEEIGKVLARVSGKKIIVCDPPRKGMERSAVAAIKASEADKIVLVSCNPSTLARDLGLILGTLIERDGQLVKSGRADGDYKILSVTPFDMFPQTKWCETVVVLSKSGEKDGDMRGRREERS